MTDSMLWQRPEDETNKKQEIPTNNRQDRDATNYLETNDVVDNMNSPVSQDEENLMLTYMQPSLLTMHTDLQKLRVKSLSHDEKSAAIDSIDREKFSIVQTIDIYAGTQPLSQDLLRKIAAFILFGKNYDQLQSDEINDIADTLQVDTVDTKILRKNKTKRESLQTTNGMQMRREILNSTKSDTYTKKLILEFLEAEKYRQHPDIDRSFATLSQVHNRTEKSLGNDAPIRRVKFLGGNSRNSVFRVMSAKSGAIITKISTAKGHGFMAEAQKQIQAKNALPDTPAILSSSEQTMLMELIRGTHEPDIQSTPDAIKYCLTLMQKLHSLHKKGIIHADIKPANIISDKEKNPRLIDFGHSIVIKTAHTKSLDPEGLGAGTPPYMPLESFTKINDEGHVEVSEKLDVYATGCLLFELITKEPWIPRPNDEEAAQGQSKKYNKGFIYYKTKLEELANNPKIFASALSRIDDVQIRKTLKGFLSPTSNKRFSSLEAMRSLERLNQLQEPTKGWKNKVSDWWKKGRV